ncbi:unnamed protein product [Amoebophrya sp. A120]|nr:unnamed protein product [Amoebophrya sp. A120]|eukprot:GSA120T00005134001.1
MPPVTLVTREDAEREELEHELRSRTSRTGTACNVRIVAAHGLDDVARATRKSRKDENRPVTSALPEPEGCVPKYEFPDMSPSVGEEREQGLQELAMELRQQQQGKTGYTLLNLEKGSARSACWGDEAAMDELVQNFDDQIRLRVPEAIRNVVAFEKQSFSAKGSHGGRVYLLDNKKGRAPSSKAGSSAPKKSFLGCVMVCDPYIYLCNYKTIFRPRNLIIGYTGTEKKGENAKTAKGCFGDGLNSALSKLLEMQRDVVIITCGFVYTFGYGTADSAKDVQQLRYSLSDYAAYMRDKKAERSRPKGFSRAAQHVESAIPPELHFDSAQDTLVRIYIPQFALNYSRYLFFLLPKDLAPVRTHRDPEGRRQGKELAASARKAKSFGTTLQNSCAKADVVGRCEVLTGEGACGGIYVKEMRVVEPPRRRTSTKAKSCTYGDNFLGPLSASFGGNDATSNPLLFGYNLLDFKMEHRDRLNSLRDEVRRGAVARAWASFLQSDWISRDERESLAIMFLERLLAFFQISKPKDEPPSVEASSSAVPPNHTTIKGSAAIPFELRVLCEDRTDETAVIVQYLQEAFHKKFKNALPFCVKNGSPSAAAGVADSENRERQIIVDLGKIPIPVPDQLHQVLSEGRESAEREYERACLQELQDHAPVLEGCEAPEMLGCSENAFGAVRSALEQGLQAVLPPDVLERNQVHLDIVFGQATTAQCVALVSGPERSEFQFSGFGWEELDARAFRVDETTLVNGRPIFRAERNLRETHQRIELFLYYTRRSTNLSCGPDEQQNFSSNGSGVGSYAIQKFSPENLQEVRSLTGIAFYPLAELIGEADFWIYERSSWRVHFQNIGKHFSPARPVEAFSFVEKKVEVVATGPTSATPAAKKNSARERIDIFANWTAYKSRFLLREKEKTAGVAGRRAEDDTDESSSSSDAEQGGRFGEMHCFVSESLKAVRKGFQKLRIPQPQFADGGGDDCVTVSNIIFRQITDAWKKKAKNATESTLDVDRRKRRDKQTQTASCKLAHVASQVDVDLDALPAQLSAQQLTSSSESSEKKEAPSRTRSTTTVTASASAFCPTRNQRVGGRLSCKRHKPASLARPSGADERRRVFKGRNGYYPFSPERPRETTASKRKSVSKKRKSSSPSKERRKKRKKSEKVEDEDSSGDGSSTSSSDSVSDSEPASKRRKRSHSRRKERRKSKSVRRREKSRKSYSKKRAEVEVSKEKCGKIKRTHAAAARDDQPARSAMLTEESSEINVAPPAPATLAPLVLEPNEASASSNSNRPAVVLLEPAAHTGIATPRHDRRGVDGPAVLPGTPSSPRARPKSPVVSPPRMVPQQGTRLVKFGGVELVARKSNMNDTPASRPGANTKGESRGNARKHYNVDDYDARATFRDRANHHHYYFRK